MEGLPPPDAPEIRRPARRRQRRKRQRTEEVIASSCKQNRLTAKFRTAATQSETIYRSADIQDADRIERAAFGHTLLAYEAGDGSHSQLDHPDRVPTVEWDARQTAALYALSRRTDGSLITAPAAKEESCRVDRILENIISRQRTGADPPEVRWDTTRGQCYIPPTLWSILSDRPDAKDRRSKRGGMAVRTFGHAHAGAPDLSAIPWSTRDEYVKNPMLAANHLLERHHRNALVSNGTSRVVEQRGRRIIVRLLKETRQGGFVLGDFLRSMATQTEARLVHAKFVIRPPDRDDATDGQNDEQTLYRFSVYLSFALDNSGRYYGCYFFGSCTVSRPSSETGEPWWGSAVVSTDSPCRFFRYTCPCRPDGRE